MITMPNLLRGLILAAFIAAQAGCAHDQPSRPTANMGNGNAQTLEAGAGYRLGFSPQGESLEIVINAITEARQTLLMAGYTVTSAPIAEALIAAHRRGVQVRVLADKKTNANNKDSIVDDLARAGIAVRLNGRYPIFHHKFMVIDGQSVETGSFNYSAAAARRNAENVLWLTRVPALAARYTEEWQRLWLESEDYP